MIGFLKQINITSLNCKDTKDHLPSDPQLEAKALVFPMPLPAPRTKAQSAKPRMPPPAWRRIEQSCGA
jgi:hypothetical protein